MHIHNWQILRWQLKDKFITMLFKNTISSIEFTKTNSIHFPIHSRQSKRFFNTTNCCSIYFSVTKMNKSVPSVKQPILTKLQQIDRIPSRIEKVIDQNVYVRLYVFCDPHNMKESMAGHYHSFGVYGPYLRSYLQFEWTSGSDDRMMSDVIIYGLTDMKLNYFQSRVEL